MSLVDHQEKLREELKQREQATYQAIVAGLRAQGAEVTEEEYEHLGETQRKVGEINGETSVTLDIRKDRKGSDWRYQLTGKLRILIYAGYRMVKQFPEGEAGFNIEKICSELLRLVKEEKAEREQRDAREKARKGTFEEAKLLACFGVEVERDRPSGYHPANIWEDTVTSKSSSVDITLPGRSVEQARKILEVLHREGLLNSCEKEEEVKE